uniref:Uncharacterized protein n=1 Tax=Rhizophora mucronata TaxID=61149 RepID=A0A2P2QGB4_RHIMU
MVVCLVLCSGNLQPERQRVFISHDYSMFPLYHKTCTNLIYLSCLLCMILLFSV